MPVRFPAPAGRINRGRLPARFPYRFPVPGANDPLTTSVAELLRTAGGPADTAGSAGTVAVLHTVDGQQFGQLNPADYVSCEWGRKLRDSSVATVVVGTDVDPDSVPDRIDPWHHWLSVWDTGGDTLVWTGPVMRSVASRATGLTVTAKDHAAYLTRTRVPITRRWDAADPSSVAVRLWTAMLRGKGITADTVVGPDPHGERYDYQVLADDQMLDAVITELVGMGLRWTVVAGTAVLGPVDDRPVAVLTEDDFVGGDIAHVRDGAATFTDVLVRGPGNLGRARVDRNGLNLQTIVDVESMFGVSNVARAARQYAAYTGTTATRLEMSAATRLHPDAPVEVNQLIPSARFVVESRGVTDVFELTEMSSTHTASGVAVTVTFETVPPRVELLTLNDRGPAVPTMGGSRL